MYNMKALTARVLLILILLIPIMSNSQAQSKKERANLRVWVKLDGKWGLIDGNEQWIVEPYYANCTSVINDLAIVTFPEDSAKGEKELRKHAVVNDKGETILEFEAIDAEFVEIFETIVFEEETGKGCMNLTGEVLVEPVYEAVREDEANPKYFFVKKDKKWGLINDTGNILVPISNDNIFTAHIDRYIITREGKSGLIDSNNNLLTDIKFSSTVRSFVFNVSSSVNFYNEFWGTIEDEGYLVNTNDGKNLIEKNKIAPINTIGDPSLIPFFSDNQKGFVNRKGEFEIIVDSTYRDLEYFSEGRAVYAKHIQENLPHAPFKNRGYGLIDKKGNEVVLPKYETILPFSNGLAACRLNGKYGFINKKGKIVIDIKYDHADFFNERELTAVELNDKWGIINNVGKVIIPFNYKSISSFGHRSQYYLCRKKEFSGIYDCSGNVILSERYSSIKLSNSSDIKFVFRKD